MTYLSLLGGRQTKGGKWKEAGICRPLAKKQKKKKKKSPGFDRRGKIKKNNPHKNKHNSEKGGLKAKKKQSRYIAARTKTPRRGDTFRARGDIPKKRHKKNLIKTAPEGGMGKCPSEHPPKKNQALKNTRKQKFTSAASEKSATRPGPEKKKNITYK